MRRPVLIAHADGEEDLAAKLAAPLTRAGYEVVHQGTVMVGESVIEAAARALEAGAPVVLCGSVRALGTGWAFRLVNAARQNYQGVRIFTLQMEREAYVQPLSLDGRVAEYWRDPNRAIQELIDSLGRYYPPGDAVTPSWETYDLEERYRELVLEACDIIDLANLPEDDRHVATRQLELRRLYVALRVNVEAKVGEDLGKAELTAIEQNRTAQRAFSTTEPSERAEAERLQRVPVGHRLGEARRLVILGDPGAGKTTMVRWIATAYLLRLKRDQDWKDLPDVATLPDEEWLPILVRCRDLDPAALDTLDDVLEDMLRKSELAPDEARSLHELLRSRLDDGSALLLLDGLDEIVDPQRRARFCRQVEQIHLRYPDVSIVATSRIVGYREMGSRIGRGFEHVTVAEFSGEDKDDFARRWCAVTERPERREAAAAELIHDIHSTDRIERLTGNPMLLTTMALVKRKVGKLPSRRADLYWDAVEVLLNWRREVDEPIDHYEAIPQLEFLAYAMCDQGVQQLRRDQVLDLLARMRHEYPRVHAVKSHSPEMFLRLLEGRTGILVEAGHVRYRGRPTPVYEFRHLTFQEYLAGLALVDGRFPGRDHSRSLAENVAPLGGQISPSRREELYPEAMVNENWREAIRLCVASCNDDDVDDVLAAILHPTKGEDRSITARPRAILAALCLADEPNASEGVAQSIIEALVRQTTSDDGSGGRSTALDAAAIELATSRWQVVLVNLLIESFLSQSPSTVNGPAGLCAMVGATVFQEHTSSYAEWLVEKASHLQSDDPRETLKAALFILGVAFNQRDEIGVAERRVVGNTINRLFKLLRAKDAKDAMGLIGAYTLWWVAGANRKPVWRPKQPDLKRIVAAIRPGLNKETVVGLGYILALDPGTLWLELLLERLDHADPAMREPVTGVILASLRDWPTEGKQPTISDQTVESLIEKVKDGDATIRQLAYQVLLKVDRVPPDVTSRMLVDNDADTRVMALKLWSQKLEDRTDQMLLSKDLDGIDPFRDPRDAITDQEALHASDVLKLPLGEVKRRYRALAEQIPLKLMLG
jgi:hypothetical protein